MRDKALPDVFGRHEICAEFRGEKPRKAVAKLDDALSLFGVGQLGAGGGDGRQHRILRRLGGRRTSTLPRHLNFTRKIISHGLKRKVRVGWCNTVGATYKHIELRLKIKQNALWRTAGTGFYTCSRGLTLTQRVAMSRNTPPSMKGAVCGCSTNTCRYSHHVWYILSILLAKSRDCGYCVCACRCKTSQ